MKLVWDDAKRNANLAKHGLDFVTLNVAFFEAATILPAREPRLMAIGQLDGRLVLVVIFSRLGREALSIVSMRPANAKERKLYHGYQASKKL